MKKFEYLLLFTSEFPYGKKGEQFLESEIYFLATRFRKIYIIPRSVQDDKRPIPENTIVAEIFSKTPNSISFYSFRKILKSFFNIVMESFLSIAGWRHLLNLRPNLLHHLKATYLSEHLIIYLTDKKVDIKNTLFYTYWTDISLLACSISKKRGYIKHLISRAHRFDLYEDQTKGNIIPYQVSMYNQCNKVFAISKHGLNHLRNRLSKKNIEKLKLSYLGVQRVMSGKADRGEIPIIVSCSRMELFKRVHLIPKVLECFKFPIYWIHFGDGPEMKELKKLVKNLPQNIRVSLKGQVSNSEILRFYAENYVSLFLSLSISEGLPVSMMEAISFGIPIIATSANGIPEIVNEQTGILMNDDEDIKTIVSKIEYVLNEIPFSREKIKTFWKYNFNASINYLQFVEEISIIDDYYKTS